MKFREDLWSQQGEDTAVRDTDDDGEYSFLYQMLSRLSDKTQSCFRHFEYMPLSLADLNSYLAVKDSIETSETRSFHNPTCMNSKRCITFAHCS